MRFRILSVFLIGLLATGCRHSNHVTIIGDIKDMPVQGVHLQELGIDDKITLLDSGKTDANGHFELDADLSQATIYQVIFEQGKFILLSVDGGNIKITSNWNDLNNYTVAGSGPSESLRQFIQVINGHMRDINTLGIIMDTLQAQGKDSMLASAQTDMRSNQENLTRYIEHYADSTKFLPNALFAVRILNPVVEKDYLTAFTQSLGSRFPHQPQAEEFTKRYQQVITQQQQQTAPASGPDVGMMAKEVSLSTPDGKTVSLSSFRGKYVLLDFWASWCAPCRAENPHVVAAYKKYHDRNFDILSVSLDDDKTNWTDAIKEDGLTWTHISDLKRWECMAARDYNVEGIPTNFLIDPQGRIVARDLRGQLLDDKLAELLK